MRQHLEAYFGNGNMKCPYCNQDHHFAHVDANMKLYRFKSAGKYVSIENTN